MPQLSELIGKKKFVKKEYRPWDLSGQGTVDGDGIPKAPPTKENTAVISETQIAIGEKVVLNQPVTTETVSAPASEKTGNITGNETGNNQITTRQQPGNNKVTKPKQPGNNKVTTEEQRGNVTGNVTGNAEGQNYLIENIKKLTGIQKNIFYYVINLCSARNALDTGNILATDLANAANCAIGSAKTSLIRLVEKHLVIRLQGKACRGGHMVLGITNEMQAAAIQAQQALFNPFKITKTGNITGNETGNNSSYSSSNIYNTTTTALPDEWQKINIEPLRHIGFSETQLHQLCDNNMTMPEIVQDAINRFAYSLEHNEKAKAYGDPLNVLMGVLRKGQRWIEPNYVSAKELALRHLLEEKRKQKEQQDAMIKELVDLDFPKWKKSLTEEMIANIVPVDILKSKLSPAINASLRSYFIEQVISKMDEKNTE